MRTPSADRPALEAMHSISLYISYDIISCAISVTCDIIYAISVTNDIVFAISVTFIICDDRTAVGGHARGAGALAARRGAGGTLESMPDLLCSTQERWRYLEHYLQYSCWRVNQPTRLPGTPLLLQY
jgi:hypothetical protein